MKKNRKDFSLSLECPLNSKINNLKIKTTYLDIINQNIPATAAAKEIQVKVFFFC